MNTQPEVNRVTSNTRSPSSSADESLLSPKRPNALNTYCWIGFVMRDEMLRSMENKIILYGRSSTSGSDYYQLEYRYTYWWG